ncbi:MAG TPA: FtsX-like permease family protein, partial [Ktedonobacteraceae bacterium]|nr:FtsX-like permease family protein [Ktedonobacteraceae bacterium]
MGSALRTPQLTQKRALSPVITLAFWRWRQSRLLLLITGIGMLAAVMIICAIPPLTSVATTTGLRSVLSTPPDNAELALHVTNAGTSARSVSYIGHTLDTLFQRAMASYLTRSAPQFLLEIKDNKIISPAPPNPKGDGLILIATPKQQAAPNLHLIAGRLPADTGNDLEIAITPYVASTLHLKVGSTLTIGLPYARNLVDVDRNSFLLQPLALHVAGLVSIPPARAAFWHGDDLEARAVSEQSAQFEVLTSSSQLLNVLTAIAQQAGIDAIYPHTGADLTWYYHLETEHITANQLDDLIAHCRALQESLVSNGSALPQSGFLFPYMTEMDLLGASLHINQTPSILELYRDRLTVVRIPITILVAQVICLILFFINMMAELLVGRQADAIAILRSRGASRRQIFGALTTQSVGVSLIALILGPVLALVSVYLFAQYIPFLASQHAANVISDNATGALLALGPYALGAVLIAVIAMLSSLYRASSVDMLALRREAARSTHRPLWQRLYLDVVAALIALTSYGFSTYIDSLGGFLDTRSQVLLAIPLGLLTPIFMVIACILLLLRFYPSIIRLGARLAANGRSAASMLALAHMVRNPRQPLRMILLLSLSVAFAIFTLVFMASQSQRMSDVAAYQSGADFSGDIPQSSNHLPLRDETALYRAIPGVRSASIGYSASGLSLASGSAVAIPVELRAVDADTFSQTGIWTERGTILLDPSASLTSLMQQLAARRNQAPDVVPAIVDASAWQRLNLHIGSTFSVKENSGENNTTHYIAIAEVEHIPTVNDSLDVGSSNTFPQPGAIVVDYQTYTAYQAHTTRIAATPNHVWLRTLDDAASLATIRAALKASDIYLDNLFDRRALLDSLRADPLYLNLLGILIIGGITALLLALLGNLLASWLSTQMRLTNFAVLRALGTEPGQIVRVLTWEQAIIYIAALLLGGIFGALLATTIVPALVFASTPIS